MSGCAITGVVAEFAAAVGTATAGHGLTRLVLQHNDLTVSYLNGARLHCNPETFSLRKVNVAESFLLVDFAPGEWAKGFKSSPKQVFSHTLGSVRVLEKR